MEQDNKIKKLIELFKTFFKIGLFTFGGGFAMIPLIEEELVDKRNWVQKKEIIDIFALAQSVPGAVAINSSTSIGYKIAGTPGALFATAGVILPSFIIITIIGAFFGNFQENQAVKAAFMGVRAAVVALIIIAAIQIGKSCINDRLSGIITLVTVVLIIIYDLNAIYTIIGGGLTGFLVRYWFPLKQNSKKGDDNGDLS